MSFCAFYAQKKGFLRAKNATFLQKVQKKFQKNGIHYCVCQFFFVILQPIYVRECVARVHTINNE